MHERAAIIRDVSPGLTDCELTHLERVPIDVDVARAQHAAYVRALADAGYRVERLSSDANMPDAVFVEDIAVVFDELAIVTRPGALSRRAEVPAVAGALAAYRPLQSIEAPATIDGGDVLLVARHVFIGRSSRTNADAIAQMRRLLAPHGYGVCEIVVRDCLHLKSAVTRVDDRTVLLNPSWIDRSAFAAFDIVEVDPREPAAANVLRLCDRVVAASAYPRTAERLAARGLRIVEVDTSELAKAEGAVTCCSLIIEDQQRAEYPPSLACI